MEAETKNPVESGRSVDRARLEYRQREAERLEWMAGAYLAFMSAAVLIMICGAVPRDYYEGALAFLGSWTESAGAIFGGGLLLVLFIFLGSLPFLIVVGLFRMASRLCRR